MKEKRRQQYETKVVRTENFTNEAGGRSTRPEEGVSIMVHKKKVDEEYMSRKARTSLGGS
jgi:hypothetical protein